MDLIAEAASIDEWKKTMADKYAMNAQELESINSELFDSFDPEQELWIIGGSTQYTVCSTATQHNGQPDGNLDYEIVW